MKDLHFIQTYILQLLLFNTDLRFSELKPYKIEGSQFIFHLDSLIKEKLVEKTQFGYALTNQGKEFANRLDTDQKKMKQQAKITTVLCCERIANNQKQYLIYTRLKNPFFGHKGFPTHKIWYGEKCKEGAEEGLFDECGLSGKSTLIAIRHYHVYLENMLMEDKIMHIYHFQNPIGELQDKRDGKYEWLSQDKMPTSQTLPEFAEVFDILTGSSHEFFKEVDQNVITF